MLSLRTGSFSRINSMSSFDSDESGLWLESVLSSLMTGFAFIISL